MSSPKQRRYLGVTAVRVALADHGRVQEPKYARDLGLWPVLDLVAERDVRSGESEVLVAPYFGDRLNSKNVGELLIGPVR